MYDIGIIGSGPAGYSAALFAAGKGAKVVLFEKNKTGGTCLNRGCIPTKAILKNSQIYKTIKNCDRFGVYAAEISFDFNKVSQRKNKIVNLFNKSLDNLLKNPNIEVINAEANILCEHKICARDKIYECKNILYAAGAKPKIITGLEFDHDFILSSDDVLNLSSLPKSILIVGAGAIGLEWADIFSNFDVETTIVEAGSNLLPAADTDVSKRLERILKAKKIKFYTNTTVEKISNIESDKNKVILSNTQTITPEKILVCAGITPILPNFTAYGPGNNSRNFNLEIENGFIKINSNFQTSIPSIYAAGDAVKKIQVAHSASRQAICAVEHMLYKKTCNFDIQSVPCVVYTSPEIAFIGVREGEIENCSTSTFYLRSLAKAHCDDEIDGFIKLVAHNDLLIGAHIISPEASSLIGIITACMKAKMKISDIKDIIFAHPTYGEGIYEALNAFNKDGDGN